MTAGPRILVLAHGHPEFGAGGAERAAYSLFKRLRRDPAVALAVFVARAEHRAIGHSAPLGAFRGRADEILAAPPPLDPFTFQSLHYDALKALVDELVAFFRPDVVHIHHFLNWGIEIYDLFRRAGVKVVATLHEYAAICAHYGQMVKSDKRLCHAASPGECSLCLPNVTAGRFFVREKLIKRLFEAVDLFVAPSRFLKERYAAWGLAAERIRVIDNVLDPDLAGTPPAPPPARAGRKLVVGFFGQITPFKGVDVLLEAAAGLDAETRRRLDIRIHGENKHYRDGPFGETLERLAGETRDVARFIGPYRNEDVLALMAECDWIIVPSVWWENAPLVIQEARAAGRPLILSNIGGMAETAREGVDRVIAPANPALLARALSALTDPAAAREAPSGLDIAANAKEPYLDHMSIYTAPSRQLSC